MVPTVLLFNLENDKGRQIKALCLALKLRARSVPPEDFSQPIEALMGLRPREEAPPPVRAFPHEMLVMGGLSPRQMNQFLQGFRRRKIPSVPLKAVLTATNGSWDPCQLGEELEKEHAAMSRGENLHEGRPL